MENAKEKDVLINRSQMLQIAREYNIFVSQGTIHRWANEPEFPLVVGKEGKYFLYLRSDFTIFLNQRLRKIQEEH
jgi:hypothetical protein